MSGRAGDAASFSVFVPVAQEDAFDIFTREIDLWWGQLMTSLREHVEARAALR